MADMDFRRNLNRISGDGSVFERGDEKSSANDG